ncbi:MAG: hypothetical protein RL557_954 [archaeon]|jgi:3-methyladenine DNA glycosylase AlkD
MKKLIAAKPLQKLANKEFFHDVKKYIKNTHGFYKDKLPEMNVMAVKFHEEYSLHDFYRIFNRLWNSGSNGERSLAIHALELYHDDFDMKTWHFLKGKLKDIKSFDEADCMGELLSYFYVKYPTFKKELLKLSSHSSIWIRRISLISCYHILQKEGRDVLFMLAIIEHTISDKDRYVQKIIVAILTRVGRTKKDALKKFMLHHTDMPEYIFIASTQRMKELRKMRGLKKLNNARVLS